MRPMRMSAVRVEAAVGDKLTNNLFRHPDNRIAGRINTVSWDASGHGSMLDKGNLGTSDPTNLFSSVDRAID